MAELPDRKPNVQYRFAFVSNSSIVDDGVYLDDVRAYCVSGTPSAATDYQFLARPLDGHAARHGGRRPSPFRQPELDGGADQKCDSEHRRCLAASERCRVERPPLNAFNALNSIAPTFTVMVAKNGTGTGTVASTPAGINCGGDCNERFPGGSHRNLDGDTRRWVSCSPDGAAVGVAEPAACVVSTTATVTATFNLPAPPPFTVTVSKNGTGAGTVTSNPAGITCGGDCTVTYPGGTTSDIDCHC